MKVERIICLFMFHKWVRRPAPGDPSRSRREWAWEERIRFLGYRINNRWPLEGGYGRWELGTTRTLWFTGPSGVDFELFEFEEEYPLE